MKKLQIIGVSTIMNDKQGNRIALTLIHTSNGETPIIRREKEFIQDLKNSRLIPNHVDTIDHPLVNDAILEFEDAGSVQGLISYSKVGDKWTVTENSRAITDASHPQYGKVAVGDTLDVERDSTVVDGFLTLRRSQEFRKLHMEAKATAMSTVNNAFGNVIDTKAPSLEEALDAIPPEMMKEVVSDNNGIGDNDNAGG